MNTREMEKAEALWPEMVDTLFVHHTEEQYHRLVALLDELIGEVGENEAHPLASLMEVIGVLIEHYETEHVPALGAEEA